MEASANVIGAARGVRPETADITLEMTFQFDAVGKAKHGAQGQYA
jgi:hypothetical protein